MASPLYEQRLSTFVDWIRPTAENDTLIRAHADQLRKAIGDQIRLDGLRVASTPRAGSFAKNTGLRRHITGGSPVEGLDVDLVFVVKGAEALSHGALLDRFASYTQKAFPQHELSRTKSSIALRLTNARLRFDIVPMLATADNGDQLLLRADGSRTLTSVERHRQFVCARTDASNRLTGRVRFNECVRLLKWWREFQTLAHPNLSLSSFLLELLCAKAYDHLQVQPTYHETLSAWFTRMAELARERQPVVFTDFGPATAPAGAWAVLDPVNPKNNVVHDWNGQQIDALAQRFAAGAEALQEAQRFERLQDHGNSLHALERLFGSPFKHHSGA